ncbi:unnamed protein product, partial [Meganyctiphanes norvegica]
GPPRENAHQSPPEGPPRTKRAAAAHQDIPRSRRGTTQGRQGQMPLMYMAGDTKKKRQCAQVNGILAGFNTFSYLTFVNGVITLVLNVNNNINNNNNNNNLNNNNDLSNNNLNSNSNTQNANQIIIMPPGRKKRRTIIEVSQKRKSTSLVNNCDAKKRAAYELYKVCDYWWQLDKTGRNMSQGRTTL